MNEATFFLFKSEKKTDEGHLKQMITGFVCLRGFTLVYLHLSLLYQPNSSWVDGSGYK